MYWSLPAGSPAVETVWAGDSKVDPSIGHRSDPVLGADVVFTIVDGRCTVAVQGPLTRRHTYADLPGAHYIGLRFEPGASTATLGGALWGLRDQATSAQELGWSKLPEIADGLLAGPTLADRLHLVRAELAATPAQHPGPPAMITEAIRRLRCGPGSVSVASLADDLGVSERQLQRAFRFHVGLPPKQVARLLRIEGLLGLLDTAPATDLARVALAVGFFDQAHMTNDVRRVLATTPSSIVAEIAQRKALNPSR